MYYKNNLILTKGVMMRIHLSWLAFIAGIFAISSFAYAVDESAVILVIHNQKFEPTTLLLPAGVKVKIIIRNQDPMPVEFESHDLSREIIVRGHGESPVYIGPIETGSYQFFNDFNRNMQGLIVVAPTGKGH
jgi:plastocyanin